MSDDGLLLLGGIALLIWWLSRQGSVTAAVSGAGAGGGGLAGCDTCGPAPTPGTAVSGSPSSASLPAAPAAQVQYAAPVVQAPVTPTYFGGSAQNQAQLNAYVAAINQANAAGNWSLSWQIAAQRDAWVKSIGG